MGNSDAAAARMNSNQDGGQGKKNSEMHRIVSGRPATGRISDRLGWFPRMRPWRARGVGSRGPQTSGSTRSQWG